MKPDAIAIKTTAQAALALPAQDFLKEYAPLVVPVKTKAIRTPVDAADSGLPSLSQIERQYGEKMTILYLTAWLDDLTAFLGKKYQMDELQKVQTARLMLDCDEIKVLNIADLRLVFESIKTGGCGVKLYGDINGLTIIEIFKKYIADRAAQCYGRNLQKDDVIKKHGYDKTGEILSDNDVYVGYEELRQRKEREERQAQDKKAAYCQWLLNRFKAYCDKHRTQWQEEESTTEKTKNTKKNK